MSSPQSPSDSRFDARAIWDASIEAVLPTPLVARFLNSASITPILQQSPRILVVGGGKAGPGMAEGLESALREQLPIIQGLINVPAGHHQPLQRIRLHAARPQGVNEPTANGVAGVYDMLHLLEQAGPDDIAICLLSGGASALLPAPVTGITLADKLTVTRLLHRSGATINEMNCVRKHLSRVKGGGFVRGFRGRQFISLIISDVVGDPLDVIGSGPTAPDPTTFADALTVIDRYQLNSQLPPTVITYLQQGVEGVNPETLKSLPASVHNHVIGNNRIALDAATAKANSLGYQVLDLGSFIEGETQPVATAVAGVIRSIRSHHHPIRPPACLLLGGETTVTLGVGSGRGGRNQEFVLAVLTKLAAVSGGLEGVTILSGGTDGEDGPTDAAGAIADEQTVERARTLGLSLEHSLLRHDAYPLFEATGDLLKSGLTGTNVMDVRVIIVR